MGSPLALGGCVVAGLAVVGTTLLVVPSVGRAAPATADHGGLAAAGATAEEFWQLAQDGRCRSAADLMWWPADRGARQRGYTRICLQADLPDTVEVGDPRYVNATHTPYGASDLAVVPITLTTDGEQTDDELQMVDVDGDWFVIR